MAFRQQPLRLRGLKEYAIHTNEQTMSQYSMLRPPGRLRQLRCDIISSEFAKFTDAKISTTRWERPHALPPRALPQQLMTYVMRTDFYVPVFREILKNIRTGVTLLNQLWRVECEGSGGLRRSGCTVQMLDSSPVPPPLLPLHPILALHRAHSSPRMYASPMTQRT